MGDTLYHVHRVTDHGVPPVCVAVCPTRGLANVCAKRRQGNLQIGEMLVLILVPMSTRCPAVVKD